jgi:hypothetical protein
MEALKLLGSRRSRRILVVERTPVIDIYWVTGCRLLTVFGPRPPDQRQSRFFDCLGSLGNLYEDQSEFVAKSILRGGETETGSF